MRRDEGGRRGIVGREKRGGDGGVEREYGKQRERERGKGRKKGGREEEERTGSVDVV
jgi:hypothetical protein